MIQVPTCSSAPPGGTLHQVEPDRVGGEAGQELMSQGLAHVPNEAKVRLGWNSTWLAFLCPLTGMQTRR